MGKIITEELKAKVVKAFLVDGYSHRRIQEEILRIPAPVRGGGFEAMKILHSYEIRDSKKTILRFNSIDEEIATASSAYKEALLLVKKYFY